MKKSDLATTVARQRGVAKAAAADQLDRAIHQIIKALRKGHSAHLPGLGTIEPGQPWTFHPDPSSHQPRKPAPKPPSKPAVRQ